MSRFEAVNLPNVQVEMAKLKVETLILNKLHRPGAGINKNNKYSYHWNGVTIILKNHISNNVKSVILISDQVIVLKLMQ